MSFKKTSLYPCSPSTVRGQSTKLSASKDKIAYTNGRTVIIRDLNNPALATSYSGHVQNATVARISPSGYYVASADAVGTVRVWDLVGEDQTLKGEYKAISGRLNDLEWDGESKRIIAVGDGREKFGHAFMMDTGSSTGDIIGHNKAVNAVSIRHQRPFRAATAGDDALINFHHGVPFKYDKTIKTHTKYVQDLRYAPSGDHFASVGSDAAVYVYDGKTGDSLGQFETADGHKGSIMACTWSPDSRSLVTASADCTVKLWDIETRKPVTSWTLGTGVQHQQVGAVWSGAEDIVSLSLSGDLNVFDRRSGTSPTRVISGPQRAVTAASLSSSDTFLAGTADGRILSFDSDSGTATYVSGEGHSNLVSGLAASPRIDTLFSIGFDDQLREIEGSTFTSASYSTNSQPKAVAVSDDGTVFIAEADIVEAIRLNQKVASFSTKYTPSAIAAAGKSIAVGGEDQKVHLYDWDGSVLKEVGTLEGNKGAVSALSFSPDGSMLAAGDSSGKIVLFDAKERKVITSRWSFHTGRVHSLNWTPDGQHCASGSLDTHVFVWSVQKPMRNVAIKNAGPGGVNVVFWLKSDGAKGKLASTGADGVVRVWNVTFHV